MTIYKGTFTFTFLFDSNVDSVEDVANMEPEQIMADCDTEHMMGQASMLSIEEVPNDKVAEEEIALAGDGTFFADPDELEHARLDAELQGDEDDA